ncbi:hypothetical protein Y032_0187g1132 [Ancylostoma ceylanicum]|uniref:Amino acid transporter transmembrane domain-containing protein n=1 Tax=Ancylostoma ceylanicum TaxID=53326 RepID=A0A016SRS7_9BILA|nr:hypothetical protein Y032_0187g1132 [Ancylostoma ceylanicum]
MVALLLAKFCQGDVTNATHQERKMAEAFERVLLDAAYCGLTIEDEEDIEEDNDEKMDNDWDIDYFGIRRFICRSLLFFSSIFVAESIPSFGVFVDLVGGSTITLMTMLLPGVFYLLLFTSAKKRIILINRMQVSPESPDDQRADILDVIRYTSKGILLLNFACFVFGVIGGIAASSSAIMEIVDSRMAPPCYVQWLRNGLGGPTNNCASTHCCGPFLNITVSGVDPSEFCIMPSHT